MQIKANPAAIGLFVLLSLVLGVGAVFYLGGDLLADRSSRLILFFEGDVRGLQVGSPVTLRGVKVGQVEAISINYNDQDRTFAIPVIISVDQARLGFKRKYEGKPGRELLDKMIAQGLRAKLYSQSLVTGKMEIKLTYEPASPLRLMNIDSEYPELPTIPSNLEKISTAMEELPLAQIIQRVTEILDGLDRVMSNSDIPLLLTELSQVVHRLDRITSEMEKGIPQLTSESGKVVEETHALVMDLRESLTPLTAEWTRLAVDSQRLVGQVQKELPEAFANWDSTMASGESAFRGMQTGAVAANEFLREDSALQTELVKALRELSAAARSIRIMSEYLERHPEALLRGKN
ncbi:MAG: MlaD family protein [Gammaproteobacteria bacterium]|nr:MlaD family protein [Gammaproteobacteria bacterium]